MLKKLLFLLSTILLFFDSKAQNDSISIIDIPSDAVENLILSSQNDNGFDLNTAFEKLDWYKKHPLNINEANAESLQELGFLTAQQIEQLIQYRLQVGKLIVIYELQAVPSFDVKTIKKLLPFITIDSKLDENQASLKEMFQESENELFIRTNTFLEKSEGLKNGKYLGNGLEHYIRYRKMFGNRFSVGLTLEKDAGEPYYYKGKTYGADFIGAHIRYATSRFMVIVGDYAASFGQGLILMQDFAPGKSPFITDLKRIPRPLKPYTSVGEANFFRGLALHLTPNKHIEATFFASFRNKDANLLQDTINFFNEFTSFQTSGLHRSEAEIEDKASLKNLCIGSSFKYKQKNWNVGLNALFNHFDKPLNIRDDLYNRFYFNGSQLLNVSTNYSYVKKNLNFFGETALSDNFAFGTINGILVGLDKTLQFSALYRNFAKNFHTLYANPVAESTGARNEQGLYFGFVFNPSFKWKLETFLDLWQNPWLKFQVDAPATGSEYYGRLTYTIKRKLEFYLQYRRKLKAQNQSTEANLTQLGIVQREQYRLNLQYQISPELEWQSRIEASRVNNQNNQFSSGVLAYQDIIWRSKAMPFQVSARYAIFNTDSYDARIYAFENNLMYNFSIPAYTGKGQRFYVNVRYVGIKNMMIEARIAQTYLANTNSIGSGDTAVAGNKKTEVGVQCRVRF